MFKIEKHIPIPKDKRGPKGRGGETVWPFRHMEIGDSFFVPNGHMKTENAIRSFVHGRARKFNIRCSVLKMEGGYRVWRIA